MPMAVLSNMNSRNGSLVVLIAYVAPISVTSTGHAVPIVVACFPYYHVLFNLFDVDTIIVVGETQWITEDDVLLPENMEELVLEVDVEVDVEVGLILVYCKQESETIMRASYKSF
ncbi:hypothetical protein BGZ57DRAFT_862293 [Hyaloscypha finlandica]|nr:hypothetical protein BGZ57DRAFT_862293 [Hyaloscypha finlandica]